MAHKVVFTPEARNDLRWLYNAIAQVGGTRRAFSYTDRVTARCLGLATFPERGTRRDDLRPGLRVVGFARRVSIAFQIAGNSVIILRILYGGQDLSTHFTEDRD